MFNESPISPRKCRSLLARIVYLLYCGETFSVQEATQLFFGVTKLFQHKDVSTHFFSKPGRRVRSKVGARERAQRKGPAAPSGQHTSTTASSWTTRSRMLSALVGANVSLLLAFIVML